MKNIILVVSLLLFNMHCMCQSVTFMGTDIDQSFISFNRSISPKLTFDSETSTCTSYIGTFAGISFCNIQVIPSSLNKVQKVIVIKRGLKSDVINSLISSYTSKYGTPHQTFNSTFQEKPTNVQNTAAHYCYKVGVHKIEIEVVYYVAGGSFLKISYFPKGYVNDSSNVRINSSDI